ncbi:hypothetical protein [Photorhabdus sp. CRCIA-P01]|uniref:hypothetical protein n=1 Tax=Photorhabdus sp. CRCIA-P01 TaxID=2019570 RepID=UPI0018E55B80|nr:hypothetical protein [Photorhabdus sp. CRCIA-P01]
MISNNKEAYVWIWLPEQTEPVVAGRLEEFNGRILFNYGKSYLGRFNSQPPSISIYEPELPLKSGIISPQSDLTIPGCIRDASPDAWGRRVIINKKLGLKGADTETTILNEITYLLDLSQLQTCLETAHNFNISEKKAKEIFNRQISIIRDNWNSICEEAELSEVDKKLLWHRQFLNPFSIGY